MKKKKYSKKTNHSIINKFMKLPLHKTTIDYLISLGSDLKNYHYYDLLRLNSMEVIQNLSEDNQKKLMEDIIENRHKINLNNKVNLMEACFKQNIFDFSAELWFDSILRQIKEIENLYSLSEQIMKELSKNQKKELKKALLLHSINNLNSIISIKKTFLQSI